MEDQHRYIYFYTLDHTGTLTTSGYSLPITPFTFVPIFDDGTTVDYSKYRILWDFGDGTTSESVTAVHSFQFPAWYNVKCYVLGKNGVGYESSFSQSILVKDLISDTLVLSGFNNKTESGTLQNPFVVYRFNSWQSYPALSSEGYTILLDVSGNNAPLLDHTVYEKDKWGHLKPSARFETFILNTLTEKEERLPVNSLKTDNFEIYAKLKNKELVFCSKEDEGSCLAGTSGSKLFYYIDDLPKMVDNVYETVAATIYTSFDTSKFKIDNNYKESLYPILNNIHDSTSFSVTIQQLNPSYVTITSNGIDDDNNGNRINTFNIYFEKFTNQKIPFVVRVKDVNQDNVVTNSKYVPTLTLTDSQILNENEVYLELRDDRNQKIENVNFYSNYGILSSETFGGYFRGYLTSDRQLENVHIYAKVGFHNVEVFLVDTTHGILGEPQFERVHNISVKTDTNDHSKKIIEDHVVNVAGLSGIYSSCVTSKRLSDGSNETFAWVVDGDREKIVKFNAETMTVVYDKFDIPTNSSPSNICSDKFGNVWVTLYDAVSTIRINNITNLVDKVITPSLTNQSINDEYTVTPASVDTDVDNNVWVSYSNGLSSFVEKYNTDGVFIFNKILTPNFESTELVTDLDGNAWCIIKDLSSSTGVLSGKHDEIVKISKDGSVVQHFGIHGSLWNITIDPMGNVWATRNINEVVRINATNNTFQSYFLTNQVNRYDNYVSDLEGIAATTYNNILVVDNVNRKLHYFEADIDTYGFVPQKIQLDGAATYDPNRIQDKINGYGDWNGFRHINKYCHVRAKSNRIDGNSNVFSIYDSSSGRYDLRKVNENFDPDLQMKAFRFQDYLKDSDQIFDLVGSAIGTLSSKPSELGKAVYERISNFSDNINNVDTCGVKALKSMYDMFGEDFQTFSGFEFNFPANVNRLVDVFSIPFTKLKGSRDKFDLNFDNKGYHNDEIIANGGTVIYGRNKGKELSFLTAILTGGCDIIAYEKFSETYTYLNTNLLSTSYINFIDPIKKTYPLSSYHPYWGWGLVLPDTYRQEDISRYYSFYEFVPNYNYSQNEGIINWNDKYTTISENLTSTLDWNDIRENMLNYTLAKGTELVK